MRKPILQLCATVREGAVRLSWMKSTPLFVAGEQAEFASCRVLRREESFVFGEDYEEYFLNHPPDGAKTVFAGPLAAQGDRRYEWVDTGVEAGKTYSYWVQTATSEPIGPVPVRVRDPEVWWTAVRLERELEALRRLRPAVVALDTCGQTSQGADIHLARVGSGPRRLGLVGLIHPGEAGPELIVPALQRLVTADARLLERVQVVAIPAVNADERERLVAGVPWYLRTNAQGVDLNRNFPAGWEQVEYGYGLDSSSPGSGTYRGPRPASAPETQAVLRALTDHPVDALLSYHCLASICSLPALAARTGVEDAPYAARCTRLAAALADGLHPERPEARQALSYGCSAGSLPSWLHGNGAVPAVDLEGGVDPDALAHCRQDETDRALLRTYQNRHYAGIRSVLQALAAGDL